MMQTIYNDLQRLYSNKPHRFDHVIGVVETAKKLGTLYHCDIEILEIAALLHDITKYESYDTHVEWIESHFDHSTYILSEFNPNILHAFSAVAVAVKTYGITDPRILGAIEHHTIGKPAMTIYEQILFISDYIEPNRTYESCKKVRAMAYESLDLATYTAIDDSIRYYEAEKSHIPTVAYEARAYYKQILEERT